MLKHKKFFLNLLYKEVVYPFFLDEKKKKKVKRLYRGELENKNWEERADKPDFQSHKTWNGLKDD